MKMFLAVAMLFILLATAILILALSTKRDRSVAHIMSVRQERLAPWVERAKHDPWVEIVRYARVERGIEFVAVPNDEIDSYVSGMDIVSIRQWLPSDLAVDVVRTLDDPQLSAEHAGLLSSQATQAAVYFTLSGLLAFGAVVCTGLAWRRHCAALPSALQN